MRESIIDAGFTIEHKVVEKYNDILDDTKYKTTYLPVLLGIAFETVNYYINTKKS